MIFPRCVKFPPSLISASEGISSRLSMKNPLSSMTYAWQRRKLSYIIHLACRCPCLLANNNILRWLAVACGLIPRLGSARSVIDFSAQAKRRSFAHRHLEMIVVVRCRTIELIMLRKWNCEHSPRGTTTVVFRARYTDVDDCNRKKQSNHLLNSRRFVSSVHRTNESFSFDSRTKARRESLVN